VQNEALNFAERIFRIIFPKYRADKSLISVGSIILIAANATQWAILASISTDTGTIKANTLDSSPLIPNLMGAFLVALGVYLYVKRENSPQCDLKQLYDEQLPLKKQQLFAKVYGFNAPIGLINFVLQHDKGVEVIEKYKTSNGSIDFINGKFEPAFELKKNSKGLLFTLIILVLAFMGMLCGGLASEPQITIKSLFLFLTVLPITYVILQDNSRKYCQDWLVKLTENHASGTAK